MVKQTEAIPVACQGDSRSLSGGNSCFALITPEPGLTTRGMHAGSLEALRVTRPKAVDLERIKAMYEQVETENQHLLAYICGRT